MYDNYIKRIVTRQRRLETGYYLVQVPFFILKSTVIQSSMKDIFSLRKVILTIIDIDI
jgi:hypothetical protein